MPVPSNDYFGCHNPARDRTNSLHPQALENPTEDRGNVSQWLTYWVVYSIFSMVEFFLDIVISWLPLYNMSKVGFLDFVSPHVRARIRKANQFIHF